MKLRQGMTPFLLALVVVALAVCTGDAVAQGQAPEGAGPPQVVLHPINPHQGEAPPTGSTGQITPVITYHGGPVLGTPTVYVIWYGNWNTNNGSDTAAGQALVTGFLSNLSGSPYYVTNGSYTGVSGLINSGPSYTDSYSEGKRLTDSRVQTVVSNAIASGQLGPADVNGIYLVLTSSDVSELSGFCSKYCGWHTYGTIANTNIKYGFIGNANRCLSSCAIQTVSPNNNAGVDGMISVIAHEVEEANTDPNLNAWYNSKGYEDADMCAWTFGQNQSSLPSGAYYNMTMNGVNYMVQRELDSTSKCYVNYVTGAQ